MHFDELPWLALKSLAAAENSFLLRASPEAALPFHDVADIGERIENGLQAFDLATATGWDEVECSLSRYPVTPVEIPANCLVKFRDASVVIEPTCAQPLSPT